MAERGPFDSIMTGPEMLADAGRFLAADSCRSVEIAMRGSAEWVVTIRDKEPRRPIVPDGFPPRAAYYQGEARTAADAWMAAVREWRADRPGAWEGGR